jgi:predicted dinucleotide-binding enzyme
VLDKGDIREIGFASVDTGTLAKSRRQEPGSPIYNVPMDEKQEREELERMG